MIYGRLKSRDRKFWVWFDKWFSYLSIILLPFFCGMIGGTIIVLVKLRQLLPYYEPYIIILLLGVGILLMAVDISTNIKRGYYDAIHNHYLIRREEMIKEVKEEDN